MIATLPRFQLDNVMRMSDDEVCDLDQKVDIFCNGIVIEREFNDPELLHDLVTIRNKFYKTHHHVQVASFYLLVKNRWETVKACKQIHNNI